MRIIIWNSQTKAKIKGNINEPEARSIGFCNKVKWSDNLEKKNRNRFKNLPNIRSFEPRICEQKQRKFVRTGLKSNWNDHADPWNDRNIKYGNRIVVVLWDIFTAFLVIYCIR